MPIENQSGQAALIILLSMVAALTVVLSIIASSTSDIKISGNEEESLRAFSAAESGIEKALIGNASSQGTLNNAMFNASVTNLAQAQSNFLYPADLASGDSAILWFVSHASDGSLTCNASNPCFTGKTINVCWGKSGTGANSATTPAVEISAFYLTTPGDYSTSKVVKSIYDPNPGRRASNSYLAPDAGTCTIAGRQFAFQKQVDLLTLGITPGSYNTVNGLQFMPIKLLYNTDTGHSIGIDVNFAGNSTLPSQGNLVDSTGNLNQSTRKIEVTKVYNQVPPVFESAIFSPLSLTQ